MEPRALDNKGKRSQTGLEALGIYTGDISALGAITNGPSGWTGGSPTASAFTVTHNLGLTANSYQVIPVITGASSGAATVTTRGANSFVVTTSDLATPTAADRAFSFLLIPGNGE